MDSTNKLQKIAFEIPSLIRVNDDGSVDRFVGTEIVPPSISDEIKSKDVVYSPQFNLSSRLYLPNYKSLIHTKIKIPLLLYFHGGGFCVFTAFHPLLHIYLTKLAEEANVLIVSVDYRNAPENPLPAAYDDAWTALNWVASHSDGSGPEEWVNDHADLGRVYLAGDSAGANIVHNLGVRIGIEKFGGFNVLGIVLTHPYFWGKEVIEGETKDPNMRSMCDGLWNLANPGSCLGLDDPAINPDLDPNLNKLGCKKVVVFVAEKDGLVKRGWLYGETLKKSGWDGSLEIIESKNEDHGFHIMTPNCGNAMELMKKFVSFLNQPN